MANNQIDIINEISKDEMFILNNTSRWVTESYNSVEFRKYIKPHSGYYFSHLNNIFLFMIKNLQSLNFFNKVYIRDGLLSLKLFFLQNPSPGKLSTKLLIHKEFSNHVPPSWSDNIYLFDHQYEKITIQNKQFLILILHPDPYHCPLDIFKVELDKLSESNRYEEIYCLMTNPITDGVSEFTPNDVYTRISLLNKILGPNIKFVSLKDLDALTISNSFFADFNPYHYLFSDCYIKWHLLFHGAHLVSSKHKEKDFSSSLYERKISPSHSIHVLKYSADTRKASILEKEQSIFISDRKIDEENIINLCSDGFKKYVFNIAQEHATNNL